MNHFAHSSAAERYAAARPYFQPLVMERIRARLKLDQPVAHALDVACGTGQSTLALTAIAQQVSGTDLSAAMLEHARKTPGMQFVQAAAERLPNTDGSIDLITVCMAFHWFDQPAFLREAHRVLRTHGWLVIYNDWFTGTMREHPSFADWADQHYQRYPTPPRQHTDLTSEYCAEHAFRLEASEPFEHDVTFTPEQLAAYLTTQSNVIAKVEGGVEQLEDIDARIIDDMQRIFDQPKATFPFAGHIWFLQRE